jgi:NADH-quinone oxidoreductase subunit J
MNVETLLFFTFSAAIVVSVGGVIFAKNSIASAMSLVACFFFLAGIYVLLWAHTIAALQVLVYAGAIMVLFLFVIMLLNVNDTGPLVQVTTSRIVGAVASAGVFVGLAKAFAKLPAQQPWMNDSTLTSRFGNIQPLGEVLYTRWLFPFEAVSLLLLVAIVGAVVVAKPKI